MDDERFECAGLLYAVQCTYAVPDNAWYVELSVAVPAPASWADQPGAVTSLPGPAFVTAVVPDEDPDRKPFISLHPGREQEIPFAVLRWFMERVAAEVARVEAGPPDGMPRIN